MLWLLFGVKNLIVYVFIFGVNSSVFGGVVIFVLWLVECVILMICLCGRIWLFGGVGGKCFGFVYGVLVSGDISEISGCMIGMVRFIEIDVIVMMSNSFYIYMLFEWCRLNMSG